VTDCCDMVETDECHSTGFFGKTGRGTPGNHCSHVITPSSDICDVTSPHMI
jgi:7-keto-8-aminopelargonate synthetase-like enzyme